MCLRFGYRRDDRVELGIIDRIQRRRGTQTLRKHVSKQFKCIFSDNSKNIASNSMWKIMSATFKTCYACLTVHGMTMHGWGHLLALKSFRRHTSILLRFQLRNYAKTGKRAGVTCDISSGDAVEWCVVDLIHWRCRRRRCDFWNRRCRGPLACLTTGSRIDRKLHTVPSADRQISRCLGWLAVHVIRQLTIFEQNGHIEWSWNCVRRICFCFNLNNMKLFCLFNNNYL